MAYEYAVQVYTGFTPVGFKDYNKDWLLVSKANSLQNADKKAEKESKKHSDRVFRAVKISTYSDVADTNYADEFTYYNYGWRLTDFEVDSGLTNVKQSYTKKYEKFVAKYSSALPKFVVHAVGINHSKPEDFDNYVKYSGPENTINSMYAGSFVSDVDSAIMEAWGGYFVVYSLVPATVSYKKSFYLKSGSIISETTLSDIYRVHERTLRSVIERNNKIYLPEPKNDNSYEINTIIRKMNNIFDSSLIPDFRKVVHDMSSYFYLLADANKANPNFDYQTLQEFADDFMSCLPDVYDKLTKDQTRIQEQFDILEEKIKNVT